jgi:hypothetical protein
MIVSFPPNPGSVTLLGPEDDIPDFVDHLIARKDQHEKPIYRYSDKNKPHGDRNRSGNHGSHPDTQLRSFVCEDDEKDNDE